MTITRPVPGTATSRTQTQESSSNRCRANNPSNPTRSFFAPMATVRAKSSRGSQRLVCPPECILQISAIANLRPCGASTTDANWLLSFYICEIKNCYVKQTTNYTCKPSHG
jgi:hypothetical protein